MEFSIFRSQIICSCPSTQQEDFPDLLIKTPCSNGSEFSVDGVDREFWLDLSKAVLPLWIIYVISVLFLLCFLARLFIDALWSPAGKGLTSWLSDGL